MVRGQKRVAGKRHEQGYILIALIFFTAIIAIAAAATLPALIFELKRDQEEECIHRGVQYTRAIRQYAKKYGRYPNRIEDLENTSGVRFLRRRYKDPITGRDFKILHIADVQLTYGAGSQALLEAHKNPDPSSNSPSNTNQNNGNQGGAGAQNGAPGVTAPPSVPPDNSDSNTNGSGDSGTAPTGQTSPGQNAPPNAGLGSPSPLGNSSAGPGGQVFGGGAIVGVASVSKKRTIREFKKKNHYDQWQFYYDPSTDRGLPPNTPSLPLQPPQGSVGAAGPGKSPNGDTLDSSQQQPPAPQQ